jgi:hypothetical protein
VVSLAALALAVAAASATPVASTDAPRMTARFAPGTIPGTVRYQVVVDGVARTDLRGTLGPLRNLVVVAGPLLAQEVAWRADRTAAVTVLTWVLRAPGPGPIGVGPTRIEIDGRDVVTREVGGTAFLGGHTSAEPAPPSLRLELSRRRVVVGEALVAEFFLQASAGEADDAWEVRPRFPDVWSEPLAGPRPPAGEGTRERSLGGWLVIPARAGALEIPAARASRAPTVTDRDEPLRPDRTVSSATDTVEVEPLPAPPAGFFGAVGDFTVTRRVTPTRVQAGELATLELEVRGNGNFPLMDTPPFAVPPGVTAFPAEDSHGWEASRGGLIGLRAWRVPLAANAAGRFVLPAGELTTFRPGHGFVRHVVPALDLTVEPGVSREHEATVDRVIGSGGGSRMGWLMAGLAVGAGAAVSGLALRRRRRASRLAALSAAAPGEELARLRSRLDRACRERFAAVPTDGEEALCEGGCPHREAPELVALHHDLRRAEVAPGLGDRQGGILALSERVRAALVRLHSADTL